ncbi:hypothetical protein [Streptomyces griseus]|uniref:hypothetical protein n=1 Tax=Streptomyces griseus TaxID=1911 RepID=UPI0037008F3A
MTTPASSTPADQLRAAADRAPSPELARLLKTLADASDHHPTGEGGVVATVVHPALAVARQLLGTSAAGGGLTFADVHLVDADCPYGTGPDDGSGCIKPVGHRGDHSVTPGVIIAPSAPEEQR